LKQEEDAAHGMEEYAAAPTAGQFAVTENPVQHVDAIKKSKEDR
jgi:hypothetical protein